MMKKIMFFAVAILGFLDLHPVYGTNRAENSENGAIHFANETQQRQFIEIKAEDWELRYPYKLERSDFFATLIRKGIPLDEDGNLARNIELSVHIPSTVINIGKQTFFSCENLKQLYFENDGRLTGDNILIGEYAFFDCINLQFVRDIPLSSTFERDALSGCESLKELLFVGGSPEEIRKKIERAFMSSDISLKQREKILQNSLPQTSETNKRARCCEVQ